MVYFNQPNKIWLGNHFLGDSTLQNIHHTLHQMFFDSYLQMNNYVLWCISYPFSETFPFGIYKIFIDSFDLFHFNSFSALK